MPLLIVSCASGPATEVHSVEQAKVDSYQSWHTGKSYYKQQPFGVFLVNRQEEYQEEFIRNSGMVVKFDIQWLNDSMYEMRYDTTTQNPQNLELPEDFNSMIRTCKMTHVSDTAYVELAITNQSSDTIYTSYRRRKQRVSATSSSHN